jgi:hypothetical protein
MKLLNPYLVLATAIVLPGMGQVLNGKPVKGLQFVFFILLLGWITAKTAAPDVSLIGQYAGGIFIYAISVLDAYRFARIRQALSETVNHADTKP